MEHNENYLKWKAERAKADPPQDFSSRVMEQIHLLEKKQLKGTFGHLLAQIDFLPNSFWRAAFALGVLLLGILRIYCLSVSILVP